MSSTRVSSVAALVAFSCAAFISVLFVAAPTALADTELFTTNPGFETGTGNNATGWSGPNNVGIITSSATITNGAANVHSGNKAGTITVTAITGNAEAKWLSPAISVTAGQVINVSDYYKSNVPTSVFIYPNDANPVQWIGDAVASPSTFNHFVGQQYIVPQGVVSIQIGHVITSIGFVTTDDYSAILSSAPSQFPHGMVTLTFDDGWDTFLANAKPILDAANGGAGFKATNYIITGPEGSNVEGGIAATPNGGYMTPAQIVALRDAGFDIQNHTRSHLDLAKDAFSPTYATREAMWQVEINDSITALKNLLGITSVVDNFAYPFGSYCAPTLTDCSQANVKAYVAAIPGLLGARSVDEGDNLLSTDKFALKQRHIVNASMPAGAGFSAATVNGWIDNAIANKTWLILMFHDVRPTLAQCVDRDTSAPDIDCTDVATLQAIVDHLSDTTKVPAGTVMTMHQVLSGQTPPPPPVTHTITATAGANGTISPSGAVVVNDAASQAFTITPASGYHIASTTVDGVDANSTQATYTFTNVVANHTISVAFAPNNVAPTATAQSISLVKNTTKAITLAGNDPENAPITFATTSNPNHGTLVGTLPNLTYTPDADYMGPDSFAFTVNDGTLTSAPATVAITVTDVPPPVLSSEIQVGVTQTSVAIRWSTDHAATSRVLFDTISHSDQSVVSSSGPNYGYANSTVVDSGMVTDHIIVVNGLTASTTYYFRPVSVGSPEGVGKEVVATTNSTGVSPEPSNPAPTSSSNNGGGGGGGGGVIGTGVYAIGYVNTNQGGGQVLGASTQVLTESQINAILDLLRSFNADQAVIDNVSKALHASGPGSIVGVFTRTLAVGSRGSDVTALQNLLTKEGVYKGPITGVFGPLTQAGVMAYQKAHSLPQVGIVGPLTRAALNKTQ